MFEKNNFFFHLFHFPKWRIYRSIIGEDFELKTAIRSDDRIPSIVLIIIMIKYNLFSNPFFSNNKYLHTNSNVVDSSNLKLSLPAFASESPKVYLNVLMQRDEMFTELKAKSGIYCWVNMINGKYYIGSGIDLNNRIKDYFQESYYKSKSNLIIVRSILKYGLGNFALARPRTEINFGRPNGVRSSPKLPWVEQACLLIPRGKFGLLSIDKSHNFSFGPAVKLLGPARN